MDNYHRFYVGWQARHIGTLGFDGMTWTFDYEDGWLLPMTLAKNLKPRAIPSSIMSMMPEGFRVEAMNAPSGDPLYETVTRSERFMSNVVIVDEPGRIARIPLDRLHGRLQNFTHDSTFIGRIERVPRIVGAFIAELQELVARRTMPLMSGYHAKIPMHLDDNGNMSPAELMPFTHILKLPGLHGDATYSRSVNEWTCMDIARAGGLKIAENALVPLKDGKIGMVSERFDICRDADDMRQLFAEEFHAVMGRGSGPNQKFHGTAQEIGARLREVSTNFTEDSREYLRLVCANLLLENYDFHLKNLAVLKVAAPTLDRFRQVRLAPAYDIMNTTRFASHPQPDNEEVEPDLIFPINNKYVGITVRDLIVLANSLDIDSDEALEIVTSLAMGMMARARELYVNPPALIAGQEPMTETLRWVCRRLARRTAMIFPEVDCSLEESNALENEESPATRRQGPRP